MRLTVVGCAPSYTRVGGASSCYLVQTDEHAIVLDMGQGSFRELARYIDPARIGGILISHLHADHLVDLIPLRHYLKYEAKATVSLRGPAELRQRVDSFQAAEDFLSPLPGDALRPGMFELAGFAVEAARVTHIPDSFAFRVARPSGGPGLVYSGDCGRADDLLPLIRAGDTLLCEAAHGADAGAAGGLHMTAAQAASVATRSGASRLILTHVLDGHPVGAVIAAAGAVYEGELCIAEPALGIAL
jgi:ribonuclease BN (tRNA processing enzyme)